METLISTRTISLPNAWTLTPLRPQNTKHRQLSARWRRRCIDILFVNESSSRISATASLPLAASLSPELKMNHQGAFAVSDLVNKPFRAAMNSSAKVPLPSAIGHRFCEPLSKTGARNTHYPTRRKHLDHFEPAMVESSFTQVNRRLEEERRVKFCGTASISISSLKPALRTANRVRRPAPEPLKRLYREEHGCRQEDHSHHAKAIISQSDFDAAILQAEISVSRLQSDALPYPVLRLPPGVQLECLQGSDRIVAADEVFEGTNKHWIVDLYLDDLSDDLKRLFVEEYEYQKGPDDGEFYCKIRGYQGHHGDENPFFERIWLGRLSAVSKNRRGLLDQLFRHKKYTDAFDALLAIPAIFCGFRLSVVHQVICMRCEEPNLHYLKHILQVWTEICGGKPEAMRLVDRATVERLQGTAPGAFSADHDELLDDLKSGRILGDFPKQQRNEMWTRICHVSKQHLIPSLFTFFEDRKFLSAAADCMRRLTGVDSKVTIPSRLDEMFQSSAQQTAQCTVQVSQTTLSELCTESPVRCGIPRDIEHARDRTRLFLPSILAEFETGQTRVTSFFIRRSVYISYFGLPRDVVNLTMNERMPYHFPLGVNEADRASTEVVGSETHTTTAAQADAQLRLDQLNELTQLEQAKLDRLQQLVQEQQGRLDELTENIDQIASEPDSGQNRLTIEVPEGNDQRFTGWELVPINNNGWMTEAPSAGDAESRPSEESDSRLAKRPRVVTQLDFARVQLDVPSHEDNNRGDTLSDEEPIKIKIFSRDDTGRWALNNWIHVTTSDPTPIEHTAAKYTRKHFCLFDTSYNILIPKTCFEKVRANGTYTILAVHVSKVNAKDDGWRKLDPMLLEYK
ncbi:hypothetical protein CFRS1_v007744 [Colletotrichum fructicola]|nr:hypothetical protein CFRS1_v007744 [Colletotrichum fructicola]